MPSHFVSLDKVSNLSWMTLCNKELMAYVSLSLGILSGQLMDDPYATKLQSMLGYALMIGSVARLIHIIYRKSPADNLQRLYARASGASGGNCDSTTDRNHVDSLDIGYRRGTDYESTYRQLTGTDAIPPKCKHQSVYASITMVSGLVSCFAVISAGFLFIGTIVEWVESMRYYISDPTIYVNVVLSITFLWIVYLVFMNTLYKLCTKPNSKYQYIDLATGDYDDQFAPRKSSSSSSSSPSSPTTYHDNDNAAHSTTPTSSTSTSYDPTQQHEFTSVALVPLAPATSSVSKNNGTAASPSAISPPLMRPSQYRAKRRSLLISTSSHSIHQDNGKSRRGPRTFSSSSYSGVGGVLPDAVPLYPDDHHTSSPVQSPNAGLCDALEQQGAAVQWEKSKRRRATVTGYTQENHYGDELFPSTGSRLAYYPTDSHVV